MRQWPTPPALLLGAALALVGLLLATVLTDGSQDPAAPENTTGNTRSSTSAPPDPDDDSAARPPARVPALWPTPRSVRPGRGTVRIGETVALHADSGTDAATLDTVARTLREAGVHQVRYGDRAQRNELLLTIASKTGQTSDETSTTLETLGFEPGKALPPSGYVLAVGPDDKGRPRIVLAGADPAGAFHAAQTLAQLVRPVGSSAPRAELPVVHIRDWPATAIRGIVEGFYGTPWTQRQRLEQLDLAARWKLNTYIYTPKDDPYLRARWRDPYPASRLAVLRALVQRATADHITFVHAVSPGPTVCYSSPGDTAALTRKFGQLWDIGVRAFAVPLDDIDISRWNCARDQSAYGTGKAAVARAQADLLGRVQREFVAKHRGAAPLITVPTEYTGARSSAYKRTLAARLDPAVTVMWTGAQVVSPTLRTAQAREARGTYAHPVLIWDNYPVNDYTPGHLLLGPYEGRDRTLPGTVAGLTANPMNQAIASAPALFSLAAYTWNPERYRPEAALDAGLAALAAGDTRALTALRAFADVNRASRVNAVQAPGLAALTTAYWRGGAAAEKALRTRLTVLAGARDAVPAAFRSAASPWLACASDWARAALGAMAVHEGGGSRSEVRALRAAARAHTVIDWQGRAREVEVGAGVLDTFVARALRET
ncbi:beta-N-acetylglucosaminidase domain-containing protein [Streptomyces sp. WI04-05B]|uniref:beta-N-acetylglucosaminidase domain-containing protein n=1 Tax=Streptomyces TaxID=1883 RepID=UPI0029AF24EB|nr:MULTISPECIES: beta-N-acetylglucosaminidase domain-containing protein [unclassified Streptomyces]MDX2541761.1 beta-N-acetylglucosaminidase domain-containing protein [Streptomyces sp. WI04-05B]MDX2586843.1 beta-N-acetylglucosaminidase domain-containing protein [Streptomyces sp. WI04-05A]MDX3749805.1 beta-N-acetylglucosaminidase domain-containing protein [Streptomyces sp. AK08-02]